MSRWRLAISVVLATFLVLAALPAAADEGAQEGDEDRAAEQESPSQVMTVPQDLGYGKYPLAEEAYFDEPGRFQGRVDQRSMLNPLSGRLISWPTGYIAPADTVVVSNQLLYGQRIAWSMRDDIQFFGHAFLPFGNQSYAGAGGQFYATRGEAWTLTLGFQGRYRRTNFEPGTTESGLGIHAVFDVIATDDTTWNFGVSAHMPVHRIVEDVDFSDCENRREWAEGACGTTTRRTESMPGAGYWGALYLGVSHFLMDRMTVEVEAFSGLSQSNFWALDSALDAELNYEAERRIVDQSDWSAGLGPLGVFTLGFGSTIRVGAVAFQPAAYLTNYDGEARILPHLSVGLAFGGKQ